MISLSMIPSSMSGTNAGQALENKRVRLTRILGKLPKVSESGEKRIMSYDELKKINPIMIAQESFLKKYGSEMPEEMVRLLHEVIGQTEI